MTPNNKYYVINEPRFLRETKIALALAIFSPIFSKNIGRNPIVDCERNGEI